MSTSDNKSYNKTILLCAFFLGFAVAFCIVHFTNLHKKNIAHTQTVRIIDSVNIQVPVPVPGKTIYVNVPTDVDTSAILREHYSKNIYQDTLVNDNRLRLVLRDTVFNNRLTGRTLYYDYLYQNITYCNNEIVLNAYLGMHLQSVMAGYKKKRWKYYAGYEFYSRTPMNGIG